jgi:hypothetical protein
MKSIQLLMLVSLLAACRAGVGIHSERDSSVYEVLAVTLQQTLTVAPDAARVFVQDGQSYASAAASYHYRPRCAFELEQRLASRQLIEPATFEVDRVQSLLDEVVQWQDQRVAGLSVVGMLDDGAPMVHAGYHFWFKPNPAQLRRMSCYGILEEMQHATPPTLEDIQTALAGMAELSVNKSAR